MRYQFRCEAGHDFVVRASILDDTPEPIYCLAPDGAGHPCGEPIARDYHGESALPPIPTLRRMNLSALEGMAYVRRDTARSVIE